MIIERQLGWFFLRIRGPRVEEWRRVNWENCVAVSFLAPKMTSNTLQVNLVHIRKPVTKTQSPAALSSTGAQNTCARARNNARTSKKFKCLAKVECSSDVRVHTHTHMLETHSWDNQKKSYPLPLKGLGWSSICIYIYIDVSRRQPRCPCNTWCLIQRAASWPLKRGWYSMLIATAKSFKSESGAIIVLNIVLQ